MSGDRPEEDMRWMALASQIDENQPIDWDEETRKARSEEERKIIEEMRLLAKATELFRDPGASMETSAGASQVMHAPTEPPAHAPRGAAGAPGTAAARAPAPAPTKTGEPTRWGPLSIESAIARGAFGTVYRAQDNLSRHVALKLFSLSSDADDPTRDADDQAVRMLREGRLLARVRHQNVVTVFGVDRHDGRVGLWMELIHGRTLEEELRARGPFGADEAALIGRDLCRALAAVHAAGLLHRDVKAQNVMREEGGRIVLMDFGAGRDARIDARDGSSGSPVDVAGTPLYLAPEVFEGLPATEASDIYSLGVLLYHLVTGSYPVDGKRRSEIRRRHQQQQRTRLRDARPDLPDGFVQVIERALAPDPSRRYETAGEFEDALSQASRLPRSTEPGRSSSSAKTERGPDRGVRRGFILVAGAVVTAMIAVAIVAKLFWGPTLSTASAREPGTATPVSPTTSSGSSTSSSTEGVAVPRAEGSYGVKATFFKDSPGREVELMSGDRVTLGDNLGLRVEATTPVYVYVANQDERGEAFLLFPLPTQTLKNPLPPGRVHQLPGQQVNGDDRWQVTSSGEREHFVVIASPIPLEPFTNLLAVLPPARAGQPASGEATAALRLPSDLIGPMRGLGATARSRKSSKDDRLRELFAMADPLRRDSETVRGPWVRSITLENPAR
jgi:serine/threonine protein kinase